MRRHRNEVAQAHTTGERSRWIGDPTDESIGMERIVLQIILLAPICSTRASARSLDAKRNVNPRARAWSEGRAQPTNHPITFSISPPRTPLFVWIGIGLLLALDFPLEYNAVAGSHVCQRHPSFNRFPKSMTHKHGIERLRDGFVNMIFQGSSSSSGAFSFSIKRRGGPPLHYGVPHTLRGCSRSTAPLST